MAVASLIVPFTAGQPERDRNWAWVRARYAAEFPDWRIQVGTCDGPWVKATALKAALEHTDTDIVIVADADVWCDAIGQAVERVEQGAPWAIPHWRVRRLTDQSTERLLAGEEPGRLPLSEKGYVGTVGGGIVVLPRTTLDDIPMDPRFIGWGREDECWGRALRILLGEPWRGNGPLWHLYHPPQERPSRSRGSAETEALRYRYFEARRNADAMRTIVNEIGGLP